MKEKDENMWLRGLILGAGGAITALFTHVGFSWEYWIGAFLATVVFALIKD